MKAAKSREKVLKVDLCNFAVAVAATQLTPAELAAVLQARTTRHGSAAAVGAATGAGTPPQLPGGARDAQLMAADDAYCVQLVVRVGAMTAAVTPADWGRVYSMHKVWGCGAGHRQLGLHLRRSCPTKCWRC